ncbi:MAG: RNA methyltransferase [Phycisphaerae bacterium]|nr:RNA methyltransferase [Phycisphaerae bacterium]
MPVIPVADLDDPRLDDYRSVRDRQLAQEFSPHSPGTAAAAASPDAPWGKFMAEGDVVFAHLVDSPFRTLSVLCTPTRRDAVAPMLDRLDPDVPVFLIDQARLDRLIGFHLHRGLMAIGARRAPLAPTDLFDLPGPLVALDRLTNHDNVGAIFRNAAAFGAAGVLLSPGCADPLYRKSIRVSVGHALRIPFSTLQPWPDALRSIAASGRPVLAFHPRPDALPLRSLGPEFARAVVVLGTEGPGLSPEALDACTHSVQIPMRSGVDSLNVGVTSALALEHLGSLNGRIHS